MAKINGEEIDATGKTILQYLTEEGYQVERVVVERNQEILSADSLDQILIEEEDTIEVLRFVGGG